MIQLFKVRMSPDVPSAVSEVLMSGYIGEGPKVKEFESKLLTFLGTNTLTLNSATSGLTIALRIVKDLKKHLINAKVTKPEVLTQPLTCTATNWPILANNLNIKWVDTDINDCNMDLNDLKKKISQNTIAILLTHWGGYPNDLDEIAKIQMECVDKFGHAPYVIEDAAHAFGATYNNKKIGNHGNFTIFSFQAIKHLTTGDGGAIICPNNELTEKVRLLRWYGIDREARPHFRCDGNIKEWGYKAHMNDIAATIGIHNLKDIDNVIKMHKTTANLYRTELENVPGITLMDEKPNRQSAYWLFTLKAKNRDNLQQKLTDNQIMSSRVHERNDKHDCVANYKSELPNTDIMQSEMLCIPNGWWLNDEDKWKIISTIKSGW